MWWSLENALYDYVKQWPGFPRIFYLLANLVKAPHVAGLTPAFRPRLLLMRGIVAYFWIGKNNTKLRRGKISVAYENRTNN